MPTRVRITLVAEREIESAYLWYSDRNPILAEAFQQEVDKAIHLISEAPDRWLRATRTERRYVLRRFPFSLVYRQRPDCIEVIALAHQKRKPNYWSAREPAVPAYHVAVKKTKFVICVQNSGHPASLERRKLYGALLDPDAGKEGLIRVIDESGEDYLYPRSYFVDANLPEAIEAAVVNAA